MDRAAILEALMTDIRGRVDTETATKAFLFTRFSIQNQLRRHEAAYTFYVAKNPTHASVKGASVAGLGLNFWRSIDRDIQAAWPIIPSIPDAIKDKSDKEARAWVADNVPGLGYAKASFFLMLLGREGCGCIDVHVGRKLGVKKQSQLKNLKTYERFEKKLGARAGFNQWLWWVEHMGIEGVGHQTYWASQGCLN